jgi:hypothetical protein
VLVRFKPGQKTYDEIVAPRDEVFAKYTPIFSHNHIPALSREEFTSFLYFENNRHWSGLYRKGLQAATDIVRLREALAILLDESKPIRDRFPSAIGMVTGFGKAIATAILTVAYPNVYGVWNNTSEAALRQVGLWQNLEHGEGIGGRYAKVNALLGRLRTDLEIDFWTLDAMWWYLLDEVSSTWTDKPSITDSPVETASAADAEGGRFALERQLEEFSLENWDRTPLASEWAIYSTPDDPEGGNQFPTDVGRIDILAVHKTQPRFLVIELKRNQSNDQTVAQILRYTGWVKMHLAKQGQSVEGLIIAHKVEKEASYALSMVPSVRMMTYEVEFRLQNSEPLSEMASG